MAATESRLMTEYQKNQLTSQLKFWNILSMFIIYVVVIGFTQFIAGFFNVQVSLQTPFLIVVLGFVLWLYFTILMGLEGFVNALKNPVFLIVLGIVFAALIWTSYNTQILPPMFQAIKGP